MTSTAVPVQPTVLERQHQSTLLNDTVFPITKCGIKMLETIFDTGRERIVRMAALSRLKNGFAWKNQSEATREITELAAFADSWTPENRAQFVRQVEASWNDLNKFVLLFVAFKKDDEQLKALLRTDFEQNIVCLAPINNYGGNIVDRSWLRDNLQEMQDLPQSCLDFIMNIFLTASVENTRQAAMHYQRENLSQLFNHLNKIFDMSLMSPSRLEEIHAFFHNQRLLRGEEQIMRIVFKSYLMRSEDQDELETLLLHTPDLEVNELFLLYILTKFSNLEYIRPVKECLRKYFLLWFTYRVPESSLGCFINRGYLVENRYVINQLPEKGQQFLWSILLKANTSRSIEFNPIDRIINATAPGQFTVLVENEDNQLIMTSTAVPVQTTVLEREHQSALFNDTVFPITKCGIKMLETIFDTGKYRTVRMAALNRLKNGLTWKSQSQATREITELAAFADSWTPENRVQFLRQVETSWNYLNKFVMLFVAFKRDDEQLKGLLRIDFEQKIVCLAPTNNYGGNIVDRSWLRDNLTEMQDLPQNCLDFIMNIFLTARVENAEHAGETPMHHQRENLPQLFNHLNKIFDMSLMSPLRLEEIHEFLSRQRLLNGEEQIIRIVFKSYLMRSEDQDDLDKLLIETPDLEVNELFLLYILTKFSNLEYIRPVKDCLRKYFLRWFTYRVPESSSGCFINRGYLVENRYVINQLPEKGQQFLWSLILEANTSRSETFDPIDRIINATAPAQFTVLVESVTEDYDSLNLANQGYVVAEHEPNDYNLTDVLRNTHL